MRKYFFLIPLLVLIAFTAHGQWVSLPDSLFRDELQRNYPSCFNSAGQLDTSCADILTEDSLSISDDAINDLTGITYFKNIRYLSCGSAYNLSFLPPLPATLEVLDISNTFSLTNLPDLPAGLLILNADHAGIISLPEIPPALQLLDITYCSNLTLLPDLPASLLRLYCSNTTSLNALPALSPGLKILQCSYNNYSHLPELPASLDSLECMLSNLIELPELPAGLEYLNCEFNRITTLPGLPSGLKFLNCKSNFLETVPPLPEGLIELKCGPNRNIQPGNGTLPVLPESLKLLDCRGLRLSVLPMLPRGLQFLNFSQNEINVLTSLPDSLLELDCSSNQLATLPALFSPLRVLNCDINLLTELPSLPATLRTLSCSYNNLRRLPALPASLEILNCSANRLSSLTAIPDSILMLDCTSNNIYCLPGLPPGRNPDDGSVPHFPEIKFDASKINCIPNTSNCILLGVEQNQVTTGLPVCNPVNNKNNCSQLSVVTGYLFHDLNYNGIRDLSENTRSNICIRLNNGRYTFSGADGRYEIQLENTGNYSISIQTPAGFNSAPFQQSFAVLTRDTVITANFALQPGTLTDSLHIYIAPVYGAARPGFEYPFYVQYENTGNTQLSGLLSIRYDAGRLLYDSSSAAGIIHQTGVLKFETGNLRPGETGNFLTYFRVNPSAALGDTLKTSCSVAAAGFSDSLVITAAIRGSFDPNDKQATPHLTPAEVAAGRHINYIVRFQNTGTDTAFTVVISDSLSQLLQTGSLEMIAASHPCKTSVINDKVYVEFPNIRLPDSNVNEVASHGFVTFRILPQSNLVENTSIPNTAGIYFDYNAPIITNTTSTLIKSYSVIPLKLISFSVNPMRPGYSAIHWITENEINLLHYEVEQSEDGNYFTTTAIVNANGNALNRYRIVVPGSFNYRRFFRLKMIDKDGRFTYSPVIQSGQQEAPGFYILGNPARNILVLYTTDKGLNNTPAALISSNGKRVLSFTIKTGRQLISLEHLPAGTYYIQTITKTERVLIN